jgi:hypothetical protein
MAPKQNENQAHFLEDADNAASETMSCLSGMKEEESNKPPPDSSTLTPDTIKSGVETGKDHLQSTFNASMEAIGITEKEPQSLTEKLGASLQASQEEVQATIDSWSQALGIEEEKPPATKSEKAGGALEAGKDKLSPTVDSVIKSLGLDKEEEKPPPTMPEQARNNDPEDSK